MYQINFRKGVIMDYSYSKDCRLDFNVTIIKRKIICEAAATAMLAKLKLRKQKS
jgi:hypothetical protein